MPKIKSMDGVRPSVASRMPCVAAAAGLTTGVGAVHGGHEGQQGEEGMAAATPLPGTDDKSAL